MTVASYITRALRLMGILQPTQTANGDQVNAALDTVIDLISALGTQNLAIFANTPFTGPITALKQTYQIGLAAGADFAIESPEWIDGAAVSIPVAGSDPYESSLAVLSNTRWKNIPIKTLKSGYPTALWYQRVGTTDTAKANSLLNLFPIPTVSGLSLVLYMPNPLGAGVTANTDLAVRLGWRRMLRFNLAKDLLSEFAAVDPKVAAMIVQIADDSLADIKRVNQREDYPEMGMDRALQPRAGGYDWRMGVSR